MKIQKESSFLVGVGELDRRKRSLVERSLVHAVLLPFLLGTHYNDTTKTYFNTPTNTFTKKKKKATRLPFWLDCTFCDADMTNRTNHLALWVLSRDESTSSKNTDARIKALCSIFFSSSSCKHGRVVLIST